MSYAVVGGGISGLSAAYYLLRYPSVKRVILLEASERLGGWIQTTSFPDGGRHEHGPRTIRPAGPKGANTLALAESLGLSDEVVCVPTTHPAALNRMLLVNGQLHTLPNSLASLFKTTAPFSRPLAMCALTDLTAAAKKCEDDSLHAFVTRRFGQEVADFAVDPMVRGICAGDSREISAAAFVAGNLFDMEQRYGGVIKGATRRIFSSQKNDIQSDQEDSNLVKKARSENWSVWSLRDGLERFVHALTANLRSNGVDIVTCAEVNALSREPNGKMMLSGCGFNDVAVDGVILAGPAFSTAKLVKSCAPESDFQLSQVPYVTVAVVSAEYPFGSLQHQAFGFLVPSSQPEPILGVIFDTCSFPQSDRDVFTVMMGGRWFKDIFGSDPNPQTIRDIAVDNLQKILNLRTKPTRVEVKIQRDCIAQYTVGHVRKVTAAREGLGGLPVVLAGSAYDGVGINDAIMSAKKQVENLVMK